MCDCMCLPDYLSALPKKQNNAKQQQVQNCCKMQQEIIDGKRKEKMNRRFCVYVPSFRILCFKNGSKLKTRGPMVL